ncbi:hypothetical protein ABT282_07830 [Streptomyces sp. NPDC000927]|uniref:hypothetical protein n=1 Tax=Streptomyces sp. NPDC000927 TaxID=3154371 RepID=UPI003326AF34
MAFRGTARAVWFRREKGTTRACIGSLQLWSHYLSEYLNLDNPTAILSADLDGRYGGECEGRWDGTNYWGAENLSVMEQHLSILKPMLESFPKIPDGYDGWWRFTS